MQSRDLAPAPPMLGDLRGPRTRLSAIEAVRFVLDQPDRWHTVGFGLLFLLIPVVGPLAFGGYLCEVVQRLVRRHPRPLPKLDFSDLTHFLQRGIAPFVVSLVLTLPMTFLTMAMGFGTVMLSVVLSSAVHELVGLLVAFVLGVATFGALLALGVVFQAAYLRAELTEDMSKALQLGPVWEYARATWRKALLKSITFAFVAFGIALVGMLACYIGLYPAIVIIQIASLHLRWQIYDWYLEQGGTPIEMAPPKALPSETMATAYAG